MRYVVRFGAVCLIGLLAACGGSSSSSSNTLKVTRCANPLPAEVVVNTDAMDGDPVGFQRTSSQPNSLDSNNPGTAATETKFWAVVMLPERCPGDTFPVVIQSHGYSGRRLDALDDGKKDEAAHFPQINELAAQLPLDGYVLVSYDQRGHGDSQPDTGGGYARLIDPAAETQDAIEGLLDWLSDNASRFSIETENTGIDRDFKVGLLGYSYGGGFQFPLALLDQRVDVIVPNGTWHSPIYSLMPGDAVKLSFDGLLCLLASGITGGDGVTNSNILATMCEMVGLESPTANTYRTRSDLVTPLTDGSKGSYSEEEVLSLFQHHVRHFQNSGTWCQNGADTCDVALQVPRRTSIPTLLLQGNRDVLFNMTEAYWNYEFFNSLNGGKDVAVMTTEGGHMNPLAQQKEGSADCGTLVGTEQIKAWLDYYLKGKTSSTYQAIPNVCISIADTPADQTLPQNLAGLTFQEFPVGLGQIGTASIGSAAADVVFDIQAVPVFVEVFTVPDGKNWALAGIPRLSGITVSDLIPGDPTEVIAFVGVGIQRGIETILVDDQVTPFVEGSHDNNRNVNTASDGVLLPGVGEKLQPGDKVGLVFYSRQVQYSAVISPDSASGIPVLLEEYGGVPFTNAVPIASAIDQADGSLDTPNSYRVNISGIELPVFDLDNLPAGSSLLQISM